MIDQAFAHVLKRIRKEKELSQEEIALRAGLHRTYISQLERNMKSPSLRTVYKLCQVLEISLTELAQQIENDLHHVSTK